MSGTEQPKEKEVQEVVEVESEENEEDDESELSEGDEGDEGDESEDDDEEESRPSRKTSRPDESEDDAQNKKAKTEDAPALLHFYGQFETESYDSSEGAPIELWPKSALDALKKKKPPKEGEKEEEEEEVSDEMPDGIHMIHVEIKNSKSLTPVTKSWVKVLHKDSHRGDWPIYEITLACEKPSNNDFIKVTPRSYAPGRGSLFYTHDLPAEYNYLVQFNKVDEQLHQEILEIIRSFF